ncbi:MAG TPA: WbqC family protein [Planctomycetota bacterium]|nr:WbqC family protein [Planctomycetota bacterium]
MIATMHQPEHLPWLGFFDKLRQCDVFVLLDTVQFARRDFQNRNRIKSPDGALWLTVPVASKGSFDQAIEDVEIVNDRDWRRKCWSAMQHNYARAPFFGDHQPFFEELYQREWTRLVDLNLTLIRYLAGQLGLGARLVTASELGIRDRGGTSVALACARAVGADTYLSGAFGRDYLDATQFAEASIAVRFQDFQHPTYSQQFGEFLPRLSAIDLLFNCGPESRAVIERANPSPSAVRGP